MNYFAVKGDLGIGKTEGWTKFACNAESTGAYTGNFSGSSGTTVTAQNCCVVGSGQCSHVTDATKCTTGTYYSQPCSQVSGCSPTGGQGGGQCGPSNSGTCYTGGSILSPCPSGQTWLSGGSNCPLGGGYCCGTPASPGSAPVSGSCGSTVNTCTAGTLQDITDSSTDYLWNCTESGEGTTDNCSANIQINGACGTSNSQTFTSAPATNLCSAGTATAVSGSGPWTWSCTGLNGGSTASCSAQIQNTAKPDLVVTSVTAPAAGSNNSGFSAAVTVANVGTASAGQFKVKIHLGGSRTTQGAQLLSNGVQTISGLAPGQSVTLNFANLSFSGFGVHYYYLIAVVDADNQVTESNENNNMNTRDYEVM